MANNKVIVSLAAALLASFFFPKLAFLVPLNQDMKYGQGSPLFAKAGTENDGKAMPMHHWTNHSVGKIGQKNDQPEITSSQQQTHRKSALLQTYIPHAPIAISSNEEFVALGFLGLGTVDDPYRIDGWNISSTEAHGIEVHNTTSHFTVSNCCLNINSLDHNGIYISNIAEGTATIINNICKNGKTGILLQNSNHTVISHNTVTQAHQSAIVLHASNSNTLSWNNASSTRVNGFLLEKSDSNSILHNTIANNGRYGVLLAALSSNWKEGFESSDINVIRWNAFIGNHLGLSQGYDYGEENVFSHNYWDDWTHPDADGNGIIDNPYRLKGGSNNQDSYPLASFYSLVDSDSDGMDDYYESLMGLDPASDDGAGDLDRDELLNLEEYLLGTSANDPDTDADGLTDGEEVKKHKTNPLVSDTDGDGLADGEEVVSYHTNPTSGDSDTDGLTDGEEVNIYHTDPIKTDTDGDWIADGAEVNEHRTDPTDSDSDGDFFPDGLDYRWWGNPREGWDNPLTRGLLIAFLLGMGFSVWFTIYWLPKKSQQEIKRQLKQLKQQIRQFREFIIESIESGVSKDLEELGVTAQKAYQLFMTCKEAIQTARRHATSKWPPMFRLWNRHYLISLDEFAATVNQAYTQFTQDYLRRAEEFIFD